MSTVNLERSDESVEAIIQASFPSFKGKTIHAKIAPTVQFYGTMYDDGNRRTYKLLRLADLKTLPVPQEPFGERSDHHKVQHEIPAGVIVVVLVNSALVPDYIEIICLAENVAKMLPAPVELTADEGTVLAATAGLKSSYAGENDYRFQEARRRRGISRSSYDAAKASLIARKLLNKAGAITVKGRNAIGNERL